MTLSYTSFEPPPVFVSPGSFWQEYDLYMNHGVPKGAVAEIVIRNSDPDNERIGGVREKGSSLERKIAIHEAEGGGYTTAEMLVQTDAADGKIEVYAESTTYVDFVLLGYFEGCDFTEKYTYMGEALFLWHDKDLSGYGVPANAVCQILAGNDDEGQRAWTGVREKGSSLARYLFLDEAEGGGYSTLSYIVKADSNSVIEWSGVSAGLPMWLLGWFSSVVDFTEGWNLYGPGDKADGVWVSKTITQALASSIVAFALVHEDSGAETNCGLREYGSSQERKILEHEAEGGSVSVSGFQVCITLDASKRCEVFCDDGSEAFFRYTGYFSEISVEGGFKQLIFESEPPTGGQFNKLAYTTEPPTSGAWNQLKRET